MLEKPLSLMCLAQSLLITVCVFFSFIKVADSATNGTYTVAASYIGETFHNLEGGLKRGSAYLDNLNVSLEIDGEAAWGVQGLNVMGSLLYNNGAAFSSEYTGDDQGITNIEAVEAIRLYELWAQWQLGEDKDRSLLFGLYDLNSEFDVIPSAGLFIGASHGIGRDYSQTGDNGPSIFPVTSLSLRYQAQLNAQWQWQIALLDGVPGDPDKPERTTINLSSDDGALFAAELFQETANGSKLALGYWQYSASFEQLPSLAKQDGTVHSSRNNRGAYVLADMALIPAIDLTEAPKLSTFFRVGTANDKINRFSHYIGTGLVLRNSLMPEIDNELGLAFSYARNGNYWVGSQGLEGTKAESHETIAELTWKMQAQPWLSLQPTIQYVINPNADSQLNNALALGIRVELTLL
jgi:porin